MYSIQKLYFKSTDTNSKSLYNIILKFYNMSGYIATTHPEWYKFNKEHNRKAVIFWRSTARPINLDRGTYFFFLVKGTQPKYIRGYGIVQACGSDSLQNMWEKHKDKMGGSSLEDIRSRLKSDINKKLWHYIIEDVKYIDGGLDPNTLGIEFSPYVVSGKNIDDEDTKKLLTSFGDETKFKPIQEVKTYTKRSYDYQGSKEKEHTLSEQNFENLVVEQLDSIEKGLTLIERQYSAPPVGRLDLLCKDKEGNLVVIELKKYGVKTYSIIDQISRYMGYIKKHLAKEGQKVRGIIVVGQKDEKLEYSASAIPNLEIKTFKLTIN